MPRYQPPIINGGDRNNPTWSELAAYYLPREEGQNRGGPNARIPMLSSPTAIGDPRILEQYRQMYRDPYAPLQPRDRGTTPSPWSGGGSAYDEIMNRLRSRSPAIPTIPTETAVAAPQAQRPSLISHEDARAYGFPEGWRNGQPGGGAIQAMIGHRNMLAQQQAAQSGGYPVPGALGESGGGTVSGGGQAWGGDLGGGGGGISGMPGFMQPGGSYDQGPSGAGMGSYMIPGAGGGYGGQSANGWTAATAGTGTGQGGGVFGNLWNYISQNPGAVAGGIGGLLAGPAGGLIAQQVVDRATGGALGPNTPQDQNRSGRNPVRNILEWFRNRVNNE